MIVRCINNVSGLASTDRQGTASHHDYVHEGIRVGRDYAVLAIALFHDRLQFLIDQELHHPDWLSNAFFEMIESHQPAHWEFKMFDVPGSEPSERRTFQAVWGYHELVLNIGRHTHGLQEGFPVSLQAFRREIERNNFIAGSYVRERTEAGPPA